MAFFFFVFFFFHFFLRRFALVGSWRRVAIRVVINFGLLGIVNFGPLGVVNFGLLGGNLWAGALTTSFLGRSVIIAHAFELGECGGGL